MTIDVEVEELREDFHKVRKGPLPVPARRTPRSTSMD
jgi:hypothetical protein